MPKELPGEPFLDPKDAETRKKGAKRKRSGDVLNDEPPESAWIFCA